MRYMQAPDYALFSPRCRTFRTIWIPGVSEQFSTLFGQCHCTLLRAFYTLFLLDFVASQHSASYRCFADGDSSLPLLSMSSTRDRYQTVSLNAGDIVVITTAVGITWTGLIFLIRMYMKFYINGPLGLDDASATLGTVLSYPHKKSI